MSERIRTQPRQPTTETRQHDGPFYLRVHEILQDFGGLIIPTHGGQLRLPFGKGRRVVPEVLRSAWRSGHHPASAADSLDWDSDWRGRGGAGQGSHSQDGQDSGSLHGDTPGKLHASR